MRWHTATAATLLDAERQLSEWPCQPGGAIRHSLVLSSVESEGAQILRIASDDDGRWAGCAVLAGAVLVPCGDPYLLTRLGAPIPRWSVIVGARDCVRALLHEQTASKVQEHHLYAVRDGRRVPSADALPDPGLRVASNADLTALAELAVQLHIDDDIGPDPGRRGLRGYHQRLVRAIARGDVWAVGPVGAPIGKIERSARSSRWGTQLAGICVDPAERGKGIGRTMVAEALRRLAQETTAPVTLHVRDANEPAQRIYRSVGFTAEEPWLMAFRVS